MSPTSQNELIGIVRKKHHSKSKMTISADEVASVYVYIFVYLSI